MESDVEEEPFTLPINPQLQKDYLDRIFEKEITINNLTTSLLKAEHSVTILKESEYQHSKQKEICESKLLEIEIRFKELRSKLKSLCDCYEMNNKEDPANFLLQIKKVVNEEEILQNIVEVDISNFNHEMQPITNEESEEENTNFNVEENTNKLLASSHELKDNLSLPFSLENNSNKIEEKDTVENIIKLSNNNYNNNIHLDDNCIWSVGIKGHVQRQGFFTYEIVSQLIIERDFKSKIGQKRLIWTSNISPYLLVDTSKENKNYVASSSVKYGKIVNTSVVERRYSHFKWLLEKLTSLENNSTHHLETLLILPNLPTVTSPLEREISLSCWLKFISSHPKIINNQTLALFLRSIDINSEIEKLSLGLDGFSPRSEASTDDDDFKIITKAKSLPTIMMENIFSTSSSSSPTKNYKVKRHLSTKDISKRSNERFQLCNILIQSLTSSKMSIEKLIHTISLFNNDLESLFQAFVDESSDFFLFPSMTNNVSLNGAFEKYFSIMDSIKCDKIKYNDQVSNNLKDVQTLFNYISSEILPQAYKKLSKYSKQSNADEILNDEWEIVKKMCLNQMTYAIQEFAFENAKAEREKIVKLQKVLNHLQNVNIEDILNKI